MKCMVVAGIFRRTGLAFSAAEITTAAETTTKTVTAGEDCAYVDQCLENQSFTISRHSLIP